MPARLQGALSTMRLLERSPLQRYVPIAPDVDTTALTEFQARLDNCASVCLLTGAFIVKSLKAHFFTGAGVSTESGIPDYRSEGVGRYATSNRRPINYQEFVADERARRRWRAFHTRVT